MRLSVVGLGKLGAPLLAVLASKGHEVIGVDINREYIDKINNGLAPVVEPQLQELISASRSKIRATSDYQDAISHSDATFIIVPTPSGPDGFFSNAYVLKAVEQIGSALKNKNTYHLVVITSTVIPGSTSGEIQTVLENASGRAVGHDLGLCYNPEFIALGSVVQNMLFPDMILIGESDKKAGDLLESIHLSVSERNPPVRRMNLVNAELAKIAINTYVTTKISYANMLSDICQHLPDADVDKVTEAIGLDSRIGVKYLKAAVAFGGPCFPRDNVAFAALARKLGARADIAEATQQINQNQNERLCSFIELHSRSNKVGILGLSYKSGTNVIEESQGIHLANRLVKVGFEVFVYDPMALSEAKKQLAAEIVLTASIRECFQAADTLVIMTPWPDFTREITHQLLKEFEEVKTIIDCWRLLPKAQFSEVCKLLYLGLGNDAMNIQGTMV